MFTVGDPRSLQSILDSSIYFVSELVLIAEMSVSIDRLCRLEQ